jgi:hypothetical protein
MMRDVSSGEAMVCCHPLLLLRVLEEGDVAVGLHVLLFGDAPKEPGRGEAVVDRPPFLGDLGVGRGDGERPRLEFECRRDTVEGLHAGRGHVLPMGVEVDEAGGRPPSLWRRASPSP